MVQTTERFARFIVECSFSSIPPEAVRKAKDAWLDCLGVTLAATVEAVGKIITKHVKEMGGIPEAGVVSGGFRTSAPLAALANGTMSHALDYDDVGLSMGHPSVCIIPTVMALGEKLHCSGKAALEAALVGYEVGGKIAYGCRYSARERGFHPTPLFGTMGATAAAAKLLKLDIEGTRLALGIAASQVSGLLKNAGSMTKPLHAGNACRIGIESALLSRDGYSAVANIIEAPQGYLDTFIGMGNYDGQKMTENIGKPFDIISNRTGTGISIKKYPCCFGLHRALDAIFQLIRENNINDKQVAEVVVGVPENMFPLLASSTTGLEGKFAVPYNMAAALVDRKINLATFTDAMVQRPLIKEVESKIKLVVRNDVPIYTGSNEPGRAGNPVTIRLKDGRVYHNQVDNPRGSPEVPLTQEELLEKYRDCAGRILSNEQVERSIELMLHLEEVEDLADLMKLVTSRSKDDT